jgi:hypothetical protein
MIKPTLAQFQGRCDVIHRRRVVALLLEEPGSSAENFLAGTLCSFTRHGEQYYMKFSWSLRL